MILYKIIVTAKDANWQVSVVKFEAKETKKFYIIDDYSTHRLSKEKANTIDTITVDSNSFVSRRMFITDESEIADTINLLVFEIRCILKGMEIELARTLAGAPIGEIDESKIFIEDRTQKFNFKLTEDML